MNNYTTLTRYKAATPRSARRQKGCTVPTISLPSGNSVSLGGVVMLSGEQTITSIKDFLAGIKIGDLSIYNSKPDTIFVDANLVVRGGITAFGTNETITPSIFEALPIDGVTLKRTENGVLYVASGGSGGSGGGGISIEDLNSYLTTNGYLTGITGKMVTDALEYTPLSTSGGTITGDFYIKKPSNATIIFQPSNAAKSYWFGVNTSEEWFCTNGGYTETYKLIHSGNYRSYPVKNPNALSWSGYSSGSYDGSTAQNIALPTKLSQLTDDVVSGKYLSIAGGTVNGAVTINHSGNTPLVINQNYGTASNPRGVVVMNSTLSNNNLYISHLFGKEGSMRNSAWVGFYLDSAGSNNNRLSMGLYGVDNVLNILGSGNVAIGGTTASEKLHVYGNILATGTVSGAGGKFADNVSIAEGKNIMMRSANAQYYAGIGYDTSGNECLALWAKNTVTRLRWSAGVDFSAGITGGAMMGITPDFEISKATGAAIGYIAGNTILHSDNYSKYALPLTGGTVNGDIYSKNYRTDGVAYIQRLRIENSNEINGYSAYNGGLANGNVHLNYISSGIVTLCNGGGNCAVGGIYASEKLHVHGNILATGGVTATNSSDERLKRNLRKFNASEVLMSLGGIYEYEYIDSEVRKNHIYEGTHYGLIYQHVKGTTLDVMCHEREDGFGTLNYIHPKFISLIAGATMENISEIEQVKRENRELRKELEQLKQRVA